MPGADRSGMYETLLTRAFGSQAVEDGHRPFDLVG